MLFRKVPSGLFKFKSCLPIEVFNWISSLSIRKTRNCIEKCVIKSAEILTKGQYCGENDYHTLSEMYSQADYKDIKSNLITNITKERSRRSFLDRKIKKCNEEYEHSLEVLKKFEDSLVNYVFFELIRIEYYLQTNFDHADNDPSDYDLAHEISLNGLFLVLKILNKSTKDSTVIVNETAKDSIENCNKQPQPVELAIALFDEPPQTPDKEHCKPIEHQDQTNEPHIKSTIEPTERALHQLNSIEENHWDDIDEDIDEETLKVMNSINF